MTAQILSTFAHSGFKQWQANADHAARDDATISAGAIRSTAMREAHALRVALGRGADTSPDWPALALEGIPSGFAQICPESPPGTTESSSQCGRFYRHADVVQRRAHRGQRFNDRGRPVNTAARYADAEQCNAQNIAQQIAAANMPREISLDQARAFANSLKAENDLRNRLVDYFLWAEFAARHWMDAAGHRWLTFKSYGELEFVQGLIRGYQQRGGWEFAFAGFVPYAVSAEVHERMDSRLADWDDYIKQTSWPSLADYLGGAAFVTATRVVTEVFFFGPLSIWTHLQTLGLLPGTPVLPPLAFFNPMSKLSPFQPMRFSWALLYSPLAVQIVIDNIDKLLSSHFFAFSQTLEYKIDALAQSLEFDAIESNIPDDMDLESLDGSPSIVGPLTLLNAREHGTGGPSNPPRVWRIIKPTATSTPSSSLLNFLRRSTASLLTGFLHCVPRRPSSWARLNPDAKFDELRTTTDWSTSPYGMDMGPSSLHHSPTDCADYIWRQLAMVPFYIVADAIVLRGIARGFLEGKMCSGLLERAGENALRAAGDVYPLLPKMSLSSLGLGGGGSVASVGLGAWKGLRPYLTEWAMRACIGVTVCGIHTVVVGVLVRCRDAETREALNWRDDGRRDWS